MSKQESLFMSVGRDYRVHGKYEYVLYRGEDVVARQGMFRSANAARAAGRKRANELDA